jgi:threonylcarbamoyladenosine tRNA methylthiotransferase MtaB
MIKKVFSKVYGCKVNQYETEQVCETIEQENGFALTNDVKDADFVVINTCTVTKQSDHELEYFIRKVKRDNERARVFLLGCYVDNHKERAAQLEGVDGVLKNDEKLLITRLLKEHADDNAGFQGGHVGPPLRTGQYTRDRVCGSGITHFRGRSRAFVKVQDGCDHACTYCIVRVIRGHSRSRAFDDVLVEAARLAATGYKEVVLTGVQLGAYGKDLPQQKTLASLINTITQIDGIERVRLSSIEPMDIDDELIECFRTHKKVCPHLHISLQSGDNAVLRSMARGYNREDFIELIERLRSRIAGFVYSTDIIVGFPGEGEEAFQNTLDLVRRVPPIKIHVFPFSSREGTPAATFPEQVPEGLKKSRVRELLELSDRSFKTVAERFIGKVEPVLIEEVVPCESGFELRGKLTTYLSVNGYTKVKPYEPIVNFKLLSVSGTTLVGDPII